MRTENAIEIRAELDRIVALAADVERWPAILPHYRWVRLLEGGGDRKVVEMAARRDRIPVRWRAIQEIDHTGVTPVIRYRHIGGVTKGMDVAWTFERCDRGYLVRIEHELRLSWPVIGGMVADRIIGPYFVGYIAGKTLATIKQIAEGDGVGAGDGYAGLCIRVSGSERRRTPGEAHEQQNPRAIAARKQPVGPGD